MCRNCGLYTDVQHQCYIQPYVAKKTSEEEKEDHQNREENSSDEEEDPNAKPDPIIVAFDIEYAAKDIEGSEDKVFEPVLIGWSYLGVTNDYHQSTSIPEFLAEMRSCTDVNGKPRQVFCFAHNLRAFDGLIIQEELYRQGYTIENILNQGAKYLSFECDNLIFRDSLNFLTCRWRNYHPRLICKSFIRGSLRTRGYQNRTKGTWANFPHQKITIQNASRQNAAKNFTHGTRNSEASNLIMTKNYPCT